MIHSCNARDYRTGTAGMHSVPDHVSVYFDLTNEENEEDCACLNTSADNEVIAASKPRSRIRDEAMGDQGVEHVLIGVR